MEWINSVLFEHSAIQAVVVMALIIFSGLALGRIRVAGISLGVTFVFFMGIFAGYLGLSIDHQMLNYAESFIVWKGCDRANECQTYIKK